MGDDKRAAAYPKPRLPSSYLLSLVLEKEEGYVVGGRSQFKSAPRSPLPPRLGRSPSAPTALMSIPVQKEGRVDYRVEVFGSLPFTVNLIYTCNFPFPLEGSYWIG